VSGKRTLISGGTVATNYGVFPADHGCRRATRRDRTRPVGVGRSGRRGRAGGQDRRSPSNRLGWIGRKAESVRALGPDTVFCYRDTAVRDAVLETTDGRGVDAVIDTTGGPLFGDHLAVLASDGRLVTCGAHAGEVVPLDIVELFRNGHRILGFRVATPGEIRAALAMALDGKITIPVDRTFPMREAAAAHAYIDERRHVGKIVLVRE
jgi:hypothetical protein